LDEKTTGTITTFQLKKAMSQSNLFSPKEINVIMRSIKGDNFEYKEFSETLFDVRFELAKSRLMDTNIDKLQEHFVEIFSNYDTEKRGVITIL
jgi:Ca2+-binding EF-hand superfamily protein